MDKAECQRRKIPWPLGECLSGGTPAYVSEYGDGPLFDFPCSTLWRDYYDDIERTVVEVRVKKG